MLGLIPVAYRAFEMHYLPMIIQWFITIYIRDIITENNCHQWLF